MALLIKTYNMIQSCANITTLDAFYQKYHLSRALVEQSMAVDPDTLESDEVSTKIREAISLEAIVHPPEISSIFDAAMCFYNGDTAG